MAGTLVDKCGQHLRCALSFIHHGLDNAHALRVLGFNVLDSNLHEHSLPGNLGTLEVLLRPLLPLKHLLNSPPLQNLFFLLCLALAEFTEL